MKNIFIAVGGTGAKVASNLVRLLALGLPNTPGYGRGSDDTFSFWAIDPDSGAYSGQELSEVIARYHRLRDTLGDGWCPSIERFGEKFTNQLNPIQLPCNTGERAGFSEQQKKTLGGILNTGGHAQNQEILDLFFRWEELDIKVDRGFYQKPFIGSAIMALFADSLNDETSPCGKQIGINGLMQQKGVRFFLCGSLYGGTGACGVPVMGKYLSSKRGENDWALGACLMAPYALPPAPPAVVGEKYKNKKEFTPEEFKEALREGMDVAGEDPSLRDLDPATREEVVKQILLGFYASREGITARSQQSLEYYKDYAVKYFDQIYLVGKEHPDDIKAPWSNGGSDQKNPLNSAEAVAALCALNFFYGERIPAQGDQRFILGASLPSLNDNRVTLGALPKYGFAGNSKEIDPERALLATAVMAYLVRWEILWREIHKMVGFKYLNEWCDKNPKVDLNSRVNAAYTDLESFFVSTFGGRDAAPMAEDMGWDYGQTNGVLGKFFAGTQPDFDAFVKKDGQPFGLGGSQIKISADDFSKWDYAHPNQVEFSLGHYMRMVWWKLYESKQA